jgi:ATP-dependent DNA helicase UvrD/PcrA
MSDTIFDNLNDKQAEAVRAVDGPVLVFAGAGSGKTRVLTYRIAHLIRDHDISGWEILAVTFTNKAAAEMGNRVNDILDFVGREVWISTFHSLGSRILRSHADRIGFGLDFTIYDAKDSQTLIKRIAEQLDIDTKKIKPRAIAARIDELKNDLILPDEFTPEPTHPVDRATAEVYPLYEQSLREANSFDFGNLILHTITLFKNHPEVYRDYCERFRYLLVDEYQDTNKAQYELIRLLGSVHGNIFVVGDDDQSIYRWRGADVKNILEFEADFPGATVVKLEQNYRSSSNIIDAAARVISINSSRAEKTLWTANDAGEKIVYRHLRNDLDEADFVADAIIDHTAAGYDYGDVAIFYRTNAQSRVFEEELMGRGISYVVFGGIRFYERKEIRDMLGYLRLVANKSDSVNFRRVINTPARGIGSVTVGKVEKFAEERGLTHLEGIRQGIAESFFSRAVGTKLGSFLKLFDSLIEASGNLGVSELLIKVIEDTGYAELLRAERTDESQARLENIDELVTAIQEYEEREENVTLSAYLERISLINEIDNYVSSEQRVVMMTIHTAKGLEFPVVHMVGLEEGLFPHARSFDDPTQMEEERRLCYVGMTRAKSRLVLSSCRSRRRYNNIIYSVPSRFLNDLPVELIADEHEWKGAVGFRQGSESLQGGLFGDTRPQYRNAGGSRSGKYARPKDNDDIPLSPSQGASSRKSTSNVPDCPFPTGSRVKHPTFGPGTVLAIEGTGKNQKVLVQFPKYGVKKLVLEFARLKLV